MTFDAQIIHWPTLAAFVAYLQGVPKPAWCTGLTDHNTYIPNEDQWRGVASVRNCMQTYIGKGWTAGPHLFLAAEAPKAADRGIFQLTPITHQGIHAGQCNTDHLGIENVGDFDRAPPSVAQYQLLLDVNRAILQHWKISASRVNVHNECMPGRTCPGRYLTGEQIRNDLEPKGYRVIGASVYQRRDCTGPIAGHLHSDDTILIDMDYGDGIVHLASGFGFMRKVDLEAV